MTKSVRDRLVGSWALESYETEHPDGTSGRPLGDAVGRLTYDEHGYMTGQVMRPGRPRVSAGDAGVRQARTAYAGYIAYYGTYELNDTEDTLIHHVEGALNPAWVDGQQIRKLRFDGDRRLILQTDITRDGVTVRHVLTWRRLP